MTSGPIVVNPNFSWEEASAWVLLGETVEVVIGGIVDLRFRPNPRNVYAIGNAFGNLLIDSESSVIELGIVQVRGTGRSSLSYRPRIEPMVMRAAPGGETVLLLPSYVEYLKTEFWKQTRLSVHDAKGYRCERCGVKAWTATHDVHHLTYVHVGAELWEEVALLCRPCHEDEEGRSL